MICLFFIPCHYYTHMAMFAFTAIWATNIHDAVAGNTEPVMGAKYHTVRLGKGVGYVLSLNRLSTLVEAH